MLYRRVNAEINLDAIVHNINEQKNLLAAGTKIMAVVKADGYGHGAVPVARELDGMVDAFAVASLEESLELRHAGIARPILILSYTSPYCYDEIINHNIWQTIYTFEMAQEMSKAAVRQHPHRARHRHDPHRFFRHRSKRGNHSQNCRAAGTSDRRTVHALRQGGRSGQSLRKRTDRAVFRLCRKAGSFRISLRLRAGKVAFSDRRQGREACREDVYGKQYYGYIRM